MPECLPLSALYVPDIDAKLEFPTLIHSHLCHDGIARDGRITFALPAGDLPASHAVTSPNSRALPRDKVHPTVRTHQRRRDFFPVQKYQPVWLAFVLSVGVIVNQAIHARVIEILRYPDRAHEYAGSFMGSGT